MHAIYVSPFLSKNEEKSTNSFGRVTCFRFSSVLLQTAKEYLESSDSEEEGGGEDDGKVAEGNVEEDADRREEVRVQKLWVKRAKRRRVLAEVEQAGAVDSQSSLLMQEVNLSDAT